MKWSVMTFWVLVLPSLYTMGANATSCPAGTSEVLGGVCVDDELGGGAVTPLNGRCADEYTHVAGTEFCVLQNTTLSVRNQVYVIRPNEGVCPRMFKPYLDSKVCVDEALGLLAKGGKAVLDRYPNPSSDDKWLECRSGTMRPASEFFCMEMEIALNTGKFDYGVKPVLAGVDCPKPLVRVHEDGYCLPDIGVVPCGAPQNPNALVIIERPWEECTIASTTPTGEGIRIVPAETAVHPLLFPTEDGFKLRPTVMCAPPGKGVSQMCVGRRIIFRAN